MVNFTVSKFYFLKTGPSPLTPWNMITNAVERIAILWERMNWMTSKLVPSPRSMILWQSASPTPGDLRAITIRVKSGLQLLCQSGQSLQPNHVNMSSASILGPLALILPLTEIPFLPSPIQTPLRTDEGLRQLINKPEQTSGHTGFISPHRLPVQIPFDLSTELQIRQ